jgi:LDH2 family malate/lactate/ureidoglycolate dehydrogenase
LVGAAYNDKKAAKNWGNLVFAIDPKILGNDDFLEQSAFVMDRVKNAERKEGVSSINLPGERGDALAAENKKKGTIGVEPNLWKGLQEYAAKYDPKAEVFPIEWA